MPLRPLALPPDLATSPSLPAASGALAGANLLLVTLDTTRADRIGIYGNGAIDTPNLDGLARDGVVFPRALATVPMTLPAHASILTGLYPTRHGVRANGVFALGPEPVTLAEALRAAGYATGAFVSSFVLDSRFGLARGFEVYDDDDDPEAAGHLRAPARRGDRTTDRALAWLRSERRRPFFLWIHFYDPHSDYAPPPPQAERYADNLYDGEIAFADEQIGRLLAALEEAGGTGPSLVAVVADHGESLGDHGEASHGFLLHDATLRVPLVLHAREILAGGVHVTQTVSQVDLMPTLLSLLGLPTPGDLDGVDLTRVHGSERVLFAESLQGQVEYGWAALRAASRGDLKLITGPTPELYDRARDPLEQRDLYASRAPMARALEEALARHRESDPELAPGAGALDADTVARLEALGYGTGDLRSGRSDAPPANPKEMVPLLARVLTIALDTGSTLTPDQATRALEEIVQRHPDFVPASLQLADLYREYGDRGTAEAALRRAADAAGDAPAVVLRLVDALIERGADDEAVARLRALVARQPLSFGAQARLGSLLLEAGKPARAARHLRLAHEIDPADERVRRLWIQALRRSGRQAPSESRARPDPGS